MLHLTNGDATAQALQAAGVPGEVASVDDILMEGPLRNGLRTPQDLLHRADWLQARLGIPKADYLATAARRDRLARIAGRHDEVVVWSEEDLFCQVNLANFLTRELAAPRVSLAIPQDPDARVGAMAPEALRALFDARQPLAPARVAAARAFWDALCDADPRALERLAPSDAWPALARGVQLHLRRFPSTRDGLGAPERALLEALAQTPLAFAALFPLVQARPDVAPYGFGDVQVHAALVALARGDAPLAFADDPRALQDARSPAVWSPTPLGREVLAGAKDAVRERGVDAWLGGVRLEGRAAWRFDPSTRRLREGF